MASAMTGTGAFAQLAVDSTQTPEQLVQNVLLGAGVTVTNIEFNGQAGTILNDQIGSFDGSNSNVGLANGIILCTGTATEAVGPNSSGSISNGPTQPTFNHDPDLETIIFPTNINDDAILEFDFIPDGDSLVFRFVFASDEYNEFVCSEFNDVFGFFLSGPGINGPYTLSAENIALVPGTNVPIAINTVNNGTAGDFGDPGTCALADPNWTANSVYYTDNTSGQTVEFDGFTVAIEALAEVQCGQTYHIKLAIADALDSGFDSAVFIEAGSFSSTNAIELEVVTASADGTLTEGCTDAVFTITRPGDQDSLDVTVFVSGSATNGVDYSSIPTVITIPQGQNSVSFPVEAFEDGISEGPEEIVLTAQFVNACGDTSISSVSVPIVEYVPILIEAEDLELDCDQPVVLLEPVISGGFGELSYVWNDGSMAPVLSVSGIENGTYVITVSDECDQEVSEDIVVDAGCEIVVPNVFSPNGDGSNETFEIEGIQGTVNTVRIFNRWGQVIYEARNYRNGWNARDVSEGTYYYEVTVEGKDEVLTGHVTILR
ncbi:MAG: choice-of-anchor L domain-containing protein [Flavobacteriales bacterium]|nr:choice-of-anchor L domain-containing protein [Flavobacteriales bacterium]